MRVSRSPHYWRRLLGFLGPGFLISVGYMDPGNWATDIAGGSRFGYTLLFVIMASNLMAILLQSLCLKLGVATERDLAQLCHQSYGPQVSYALWIGAEIAIAACDLAEVIGSAIALNLLFHIPLFYGVLITSAGRAADSALAALGLPLHRGAGDHADRHHSVLLFVQSMLLPAGLLAGAKSLFIPSTAIVTNPEMLYIAIGILGATVMPHNLYLHSSIVQSRKYERTPEGKREAIHDGQYRLRRRANHGSICECGHFDRRGGGLHRSGHFEVAAIQDAYKLLSPLIGAPAPARSLPLLCSPVGRTRRSPAHWPGRW